ncbi:MAG: hypothetical protein ACK4WJ_05815 [Endomicrobiia bacterium]
MVVGVITVFKKLKHGMYNTKIKKVWRLFLCTFIVYILVIHIPKWKAVQYLVPLYFVFAIFSAYGIIIIDKNGVLRKFFAYISCGIIVLWLVFPIIPSTLDSNEFKELSKLFEEIKKVENEIITLNNQEFWHFSNGLLFYLDKKVVALEEKDFVNSLTSGPKKHFVLKKEDFNKLVLRYNLQNIRILKENKESVLFVNKQ